MLRCEIDITWNTRGFGSTIEFTHTTFTTD